MEIHPEYFLLVYDCTVLHYCSENDIKKRVWKPQNSTSKTMKWIFPSVILKFSASYLIVFFFSAYLFAKQKWKWKTQLMKWITRYLKSNMNPEEKDRFHFFNSFFFRKLADLDRDPSKACEGRAAFLRVRRWTAKVDLFGKDFIFIPVNFR